MSVDYFNPARESASTTLGLVSRYKVLHNAFQIDDQMERLCEDLRAKDSNIMREGSGLIIDTVKFAKLGIIKYNPLAGATYSHMSKLLR